MMIPDQDVSLCSSPGSRLRGSAHNVVTTYDYNLLIACARMPPVVSLVPPAPPLAPACTRTRTRAPAHPQAVPRCPPTRASEAKERKREAAKRARTAARKNQARRPFHPAPCSCLIPKRSLAWLLAAAAAELVFDTRTAWNVCDHAGTIPGLARKQREHGPSRADSVPLNEADKQ